MDIKIYKHNFDLTEPFQEYLEEKFGALDKYKMDIAAFHVELTRDQRHKKGEVYKVEVHIKLPGKQSLTLSEIHEDAHAAVDLLQTKIARQLVKIKAKKRTQLRRGARLMKSIKFWKRNKDY